MIQAKTNLRHA